MSNINSLPHEVLCVVFGYLSLDDLVNIVPNVCEEWKVVSWDILLWRNRTYRPAKGLNVQNVICFMQKFPRLHHLDLTALTSDCYINIDKILDLIYVRFPELESLSMDVCALYSCTEMNRLFEQLSNLTSLGLVVNEDHPKLLCKMSDTNLKYLSLTNFDLLDHSFADFVCCIVRCCPLESLKLCLGIGDINHMPLILNTAKHVLTYFEFYVVHTLQQTSLRNIFAPCHNLKTLKISTRESSTIDFMDLTNFGKLPCLRELAVTNFQLAPYSLPYFFSQNSWEHLAVLNLNGTGTLENDSLHQVFGRCPNLQSLDVGHSNISDLGLLQLCTHCPKLRHLCVSLTSLTDVSLANLWKCSLLETLLMFMCRNFTSKVLCYIIKCPNLKFIDVSSNSWMTDRDVVALLECRRLETLRIGFCESVSGIFFHNVVNFPRTLREIELSRFIHEDFYRQTCKKLQSLKVTTVDKYSEYRLANDTSAYP